MKVKLSLLLVSTVVLAAMLPSQNAIAAEQQATHKSNKETKRVPAMRNRVYSQLARAQSLADAGDKAAGFAVLDEVKERINSLNSYERAMMFNFYGFMHYANNDLAPAIASFKQVVAEQAIPDSLLTSTLYSLAQLSMQLADFDGALVYLKQWQQAHNKPLTANQEMLFAQVYYQDKHYVDALMHIENSIKILTAENKIPKENDLILKRATHYELNQPEAVTQVMEQLVRWYDKPKYWLQLAGMYGETGEEKKQIAVMEAAYQAGYVAKAADIITLSQLYLFHEAPFKAANLLAEAIDNGAVTAQEKNLDLLARAYLAAKEDTKAIKVFKTLTTLVDNGKYDALLAQTYLNNEKWQLAIDFATSAITKAKTAANATDKNKVSYLANMYLVQGMANFNLNNFEPSLSAFTQASAFNESKKTAQQWYKYVEREHKNYQRQQVSLAMLL